MALQFRDKYLRESTACGTKVPTIEIRSYPECIIAWKLPNESGFGSTELSAGPGCQ